MASYAATHADTKIAPTTRKPRVALGASGTHQEGNSERYSRQRVANIVDQVGEQSNAVRRDEDDSLRDSGDSEDDE